MIDLGGQWIGSKQDAALQVIRELGLTLHPQYNKGKRVLHLSGVVSTYRGMIPNASLSVLVDAQLALLYIAILGFFLWLFPGGFLARAADGMSVDGLMSRCMWTVGGRALVRVVVQGLFGCEPGDLSLNAFCRYINASGGVNPMVEIGEGTLQAYTLVGGMQQVSEGLLSRASGSGRVHVFLGHHCVSLRQSSLGVGPVAVTCSNGASFSADCVVLALPPPLAASITFNPPLDPARSLLMEGARMGAIIKSVAVYGRAFWREEGFSGEAIADTTGGGPGTPSSSEKKSPVFNTFDNTIPPSYYGTVASSTSSSKAKEEEPLPGSLPSLVLFINGARATEWSGRPAEERKEAALAQLSRWFGPQALQPIEYHEKDWVADPHTRGCPIASYPAALLAQYGLGRSLATPSWGEPVSEPLGAGSGVIHRLHWAGTECATISTGFVDGAIRAGQTAAKGICMELPLLRSVVEGLAVGGGVQLTNPAAISTNATSNTTTTITIISHSHHHKQSPLLQS